MSKSCEMPTTTRSTIFQKYREVISNESLIELNKSLRNKLYILKKGKDDTTIAYQELFNIFSDSIKQSWNENILYELTNFFISLDFNIVLKFIRFNNNLLYILEKLFTKLCYLVPDSMHRFQFCKCIQHFISLFIGKYSLQNEIVKSLSEKDEKKGFQPINSFEFKTFQNALMNSIETLYCSSVEINNKRITQRLDSEQFGFTFIDKLIFTYLQMYENEEITRNQISTVINSCYNCLEYIHFFPTRKISFETHIIRDIIICILYIYNIDAVSAIGLKEEVIEQSLEEFLYVWKMVATICFKEIVNEENMSFQLVNVFEIIIENTFQTLPKMKEQRMNIEKEQKDKHIRDIEQYSYLSFKKEKFPYLLATFQKIFNCGVSKPQKHNFIQSISQIIQNYKINDVDLLTADYINEMNELEVDFSIFLKRIGEEINEKNQSVIELITSMNQTVFEIQTDWHESKRTNNIQTSQSNSTQYSEYSTTNINKTILSKHNYLQIIQYFSSIDMLLKFVLISKRCLNATNKIEQNPLFETDSSLLDESILNSFYPINSLNLSLKLFKSIKTIQLTTNTLKHCSFLPSTIEQIILPHHPILLTSLTPNISQLIIDLTLDLTDESIDLTTFNQLNFKQLQRLYLRVYSTTDMYDFFLNEIVNQLNFLHITLIENPDISDVSEKIQVKQLEIFINELYDYLITYHIECPLIIHTEQFPTSFNFYQFHQKNRFIFTEEYWTFSNTNDTITLPIQFDSEILYQVYLSSSFQENNVFINKYYPKALYLLTEYNHTNTINISSCNTLSSLVVSDQITYIDCNLLHNIFPSLQTLQVQSFGEYSIHLMFITKLIFMNSTANIINFTPFSNDQLSSLICINYSIPNNVSLRNFTNLTSVIFTNVSFHSTSFPIDTFYPTSLISLTCSPTIIPTSLNIVNLDITDINEFDNIKHIDISKYAHLTNLQLSLLEKTNISLPTSLITIGIDGQYCKTLKKFNFMNYLLLTTIMFEQIKNWKVYLPPSLQYLYANESNIKLLNHDILHLKEIYCYDSKISGKKLKYLTTHVVKYKK